MVNDDKVLASTPYLFQCWRVSLNITTINRHVRRCAICREYVIYRGSIYSSQIHKTKHTHVIIVTTYALQILREFARKQEHQVSSFGYWMRPLYCYRVPYVLVLTFEMCRILSRKGTVGYMIAEPCHHELTICSPSWTKVKCRVLSFALLRCHGFLHYRMTQVLNR